MSKSEVAKYIKERQETLDKVKDLIINKLNVNLSKDEVDDDSPLFGMGLGLDSIDALELVVGIEEEFGISVGEGNMHIFKSVNSLVDYIFEAKSKL